MDLKNRQTSSQNPSASETCLFIHSFIHSLIHSIIYSSRRRFTLRGVSPVDDALLPVKVEGSGIFAVADDGGEVDVFSGAGIQLDQLNVAPVRVKKPIGWEEIHNYVMRS